MRRSIGTAVSGIVLATALVAVPGFSNADTIRYDDGGFGSVQQSLSGLGYDTSGPSIESTAETFIVPGTSGGATRLDFTYIRDTNRKGRVRHIHLARPEEKYVCRKYSAGAFEIPVQVTFAFQVPFFE
jgi:hypothetical protein